MHLYIGLSLLWNFSLISGRALCENFYTEGFSNFNDRSVAEITNTGRVARHAGCYMMQTYNFIHRIRSNVAGNTPLHSFEYYELYNLHSPSYLIKVHHNFPRSFINVGTDCIVVFDAVIFSSPISAICCPNVSSEVRFAISLSLQ